MSCGSITNITKRAIRLLFLKDWVVNALHTIKRTTVQQIIQPYAIRLAYSLSG